MRLSHKDQQDKFVRLLASLQARKFYGEVTLNIQAGNIVLVEHSEKTKLEEVTDEDAKSSP